MNLTPEFIAQVAETHTIVLEMHHRLFGNGQPGELEQLRERVKSLEVWKYTITGGAMVVGAVVGWLLKH